MRALILRRVGLIESGGGGPVIVGRDGDARRAAPGRTSSPRNGHPHQRLDPEADAGARTLIERFQVEPDELPIVLCPGGQLLRNPTEDAARPLPRPGRADRPGQVYDVAVSAPARPGSRPRSMPARKGCRCWCSTAASFGGQAGASARIENYLGFPTGISGMALMGAGLQPGAEVRRRDGDPRRGDEAGACGSDAAPPPARDWRARSRPAPWCSPPARATAGSTSPTSRTSRERRSTTGPRRSRRRLVRGAGGRAGRRRQLGGPGGRLSRQPGGSASSMLAPPAARRHHVALSDRPDRRPAPTSRSCEGVEIRRARRRGRRSSRRSAGAQLRLGRRDAAARCASCSSFIGADPNTDWLARSGIKLDARGFVCTGADAGGDGRHAARDQPRAASSRSATCAPVRSSASPRRWATAPRWSRRSTLSGPAGTGTAGRPGR